MRGVGARLPNGFTSAIDLCFTSSNEPSRPGSGRPFRGEAYSISNAESWAKAVRIGFVDYLRDFGSFVNAIPQLTVCITSLRRFAGPRVPEPCEIAE